MTLRLHHNDVAQNQLVGRTPRPATDDLSGVNGRNALPTTAECAPQFNASDTRRDHKPALPFQDATTFSFRRSAPYAIGEAVRQRVIKALAPHRAFRAHSLCGLDPCALGRKEQGRLRAPTAPVQHPGWLDSLVGEHATTQRALRTARNRAATAFPCRGRSSRPASPTADRIAPTRDTRRSGEPTPCHRRHDGTLARRANRQTVDDPPAA